MGDETISVSGYNEASYKMLRLHESQRKISFVNQDLLKFYPELGGYGFNIKITELGNLRQEVWGKLDDKNKKKLTKWRKLIDSFLEYKPIHEIKKIVDMEGERKQKKVNMENFKALREMLELTHSYINELLEAAGYSTFTMDDDDGDPYN